MMIVCHFDALLSCFDAELSSLEVFLANLGDIYLGKSKTSSQIQKREHFVANHLPLQTPSLIQTLPIVNA